MASDEEFDAEAWLARQLGQPPTPADPPAEPPPAGPPPSESPPAEPPPLTEPPPLVEPPVPVHPDIPTQAMQLPEPPAPNPDQPMFRSRRRQEEYAASMDTSLEGTEILGVPEGVGIAVPPGEGFEVAPPAGEDLAAIFGADAFQDYADEPLIATGRQLAVYKAPAQPRGKMPRNQKILLSVAGGLVGALALVALFLLGTRISHLFGPSPAVVASPSATPSPSASGPIVLPLGPLAAGTYAWDELLGTECLEPYTSPWEEEYTVVPCTEPHDGQMVRRGTFTEDTAYPGLEMLASRMNLLCTDPAYVDYTLTAGITDLQFAASYAATSSEWADGHHDYFCFVNRASGEPLTGTIAKPPVAPVPAPAP